MLCQSVIWAGFGLPVSESGTLAERLLWLWATERSARPQSGILSGFAHMLCLTHPSKSRLSLGRQHIACYVVWAALLSAVALRTLYFTHFKLFYFPNVIGLVQRIVRFVCVRNRKPRTERFNTNTRIVTPLVYMYIRGGTVHRCHGSVRTSVRGSRFDTISVQHKKKKKSTMLGFFSFILNRQ